MDIRKKILSLVGVLALTMSMTAGITAAQEAPLVDESDTVGLTLNVNCGPTNAGTGSVALTAAGGAESVAFEEFDPSNPATVSTPQKAFRVDITLGNCPGTAWSVTAAITDFASGTDVISGEHFQLPIGEPNSSAGWTTDGTTPAGNVIGPSGIVGFDNNGTTNVGDKTLASPIGTASGSMFMEFTGQMVGLPNTTPDGNYSAEFTVTFTPSNP